MHKPSKIIEKKPSDTFLHNVFWSGLLAKGRDGEKPKRAYVLNVALKLVLERFFDPDLWEAHYLENFLEAVSQPSVQVYNI